MIVIMNFQERVDFRQPGEWTDWDWHRWELQLCKQQGANVKFGATSATGGRVNFFVSCVNFLKQREMLYNFNPKWFHCVNLCATFTQNV